MGLSKKRLIKDANWFAEKKITTKNNAGIKVKFMLKINTKNIWKGGLTQMEPSYKYFKNEACCYYPCHTGMKGEDFNCLFCYCPLNRYKDCPGNPRYIRTKSGKMIKNCSECTFPHEPENYEQIIKFLTDKMQS